MPWVPNGVNSLTKFAKHILFVVHSDLILSLFIKTAKYYFPGDYAVQNGEAFKHFETRF